MVDDASVTVACLFQFEAVNKIFSSYLSQAAFASNNLFNELKKNVVYPDICPIMTSPLWRTLPEQCFPLKQLETDLQRLITTVREDLRLKDQDLAKYGNKHSNLIQMDYIDKALDLQGLEIPLPHGIASDDVTTFLQKKAPEVFQHWTALKDLYALYRGETPFLQAPEVQEDLKQIDQLIERAFTQSDDLTEINAPIDWLQEREKAGDFLMVRSTGAEDSKQASNAGGNVSRSYVKATPAAFLEAVGSVVKSYFGPASLQNRINAGINPFEEEIKLAVTVQQLIGEPVGGAKNVNHIPVSFVLFTNEPLYIGDEKFRVMRISASYGHGDGVVSSQGIATDTILLLQSESHPDHLYTLYDNQKKPVRLAPVKQGEQVALGKLDNPKQLIDRPALNGMQLAQIYRSGVVMESFYEGHATDIEGVVIGDNVYFVQARPVNRKPLLPTFLKGKVGVVEKLQAESLVPGRASVVIASKKEDVLFASTLEEAEKISAARGLGSYKLIVVSQPEPQNSHPVVNFSSLGIPCLYASDETAVKELIERIDENLSLAFCMQTATINLWDRRLGAIEEHVEEGFAVHPAKIAISLPIRSSFKTHPEKPGALNDLLIQLREVSSSQEGKKILQKTLQQKNRLTENIARIEGALQAGSFGPEAYQRLEVLKALEEKIEQVLGEVDAHLQHPKGRLETLFHVKALETILTRSSQKGGIAQYSLLDAKPMIRELDLLFDYQKELSHPAYCAELLLAGVQAANPEAFLPWRAFLKGLETEIQEKRISADEMKTFKEVVRTLQKTGALPRWITFLPKQSDPFALFKAAVEEFTSSDLQLIRELAGMRDAFEQKHNLIEAFANPATYDKAWEDLKQSVELLSSKDWLRRIQYASPTTRSIGYKVMENALTLLDDSVKTVQASDWFKENKGVLFKKMLYPYFQLMKSWAGIVPDKQMANIAGKRSLAEYLDGIERILKTLDDTGAASLLPSRNFSVSTAVLREGTVVGLEEPETLEDMLTLLHQNSINWLSALNQDLLTADNIEQSMLPRDIKQALNELETKQFGIEIKRTGIEISEETIALHYNIPLRHHSGHIDLIYDIRAAKFVMKGHLLGFNVNNRWSVFKMWSEILEKTRIFSAAHPTSVNNQQFTFVWNVTPETLPSAFIEYAEMVNMTIGRSDVSAFRGLDENMFTGLFNRWKSNLEIYTNAIITAQEAAKSQDWSTKNRGLLLFKDLVEREQSYTEAIIAAQEAVNSDNWSVRENGVKLLQALVEKEQGYTEATFLAQEAIKSENRDTRDWGLELFKTLFEKELGYAEAILAAQEAMKSENSDILSGGLELFKALFEKKQGYAEAILLAQEAVKSENWSMRYVGPLLFRTLFEKELGYVEAIIAAQEAVKNKACWHTRSIGLDIFRALFEKKQGYAEAILLAQEAVKIEDWSIRGIGLEIFRALFEKKQGYAEAAIAAQEAMKIEDGGIRDHGLTLFKALLEKEQGYAEALIAAQEAVKSENQDILSAGLELFKALLEKKQGYAEAIIAAQEAMKSKDSNIRDKGLTLFKALVGEGQGYAESIIAAQEAMKNEDSNIKDKGLTLFKALLEKEQGYAEAIIAAQEDMRNEEFNFPDPGLELFNALIEKGQGCTEAIISAQEAVKNKKWSVGHKGLVLFRVLVEKGQGYAEATIAVQETMKNENFMIQDMNQQLVSALSEKGVTLLP